MSNWFLFYTIETTIVNRNVSIYDYYILKKNPYGKMEKKRFAIKVTLSHVHIYGELAKGIIYENTHVMGVQMG